MADPIFDDEPDATPPQGSGLCLSGGGYRAMLFHVGSLWRLHELGLLRGVDRISSVSGGSITAGVLAAAWSKLGADIAPYQSHVVAPIRALAGKTLDVPSGIAGIALPGSIGHYLANAYDAHLFHGATLQDLPDHPRLVINATNLETASLWRFSKPYARDYRVGSIEKPKFKIAAAVAASSAFPPFLSPYVLDVVPSDFAVAETGTDDRFRHDISLTDGGVYDNLGLETVWKRCATVFVSDGGGRIDDDPSPPGDWARGSKRVLDVIDHQVRNLRKRQLIGSLVAGTRKGAYWGIRSNIANFHVGDPLGCPIAATLKLAETATRLKRLDETLQKRLINWGYAVSDAALRAHAQPPPAQPPAWPYPDVGVG